MKKELSLFFVVAVLFMLGCDEMSDFEFIESKCGEHAERDFSTSIACFFIKHQLTEKAQEKKNPKGCTERQKWDEKDKFCVCKDEYPISIDFDCYTLAERKEKGNINDCSGITNKQTENACYKTFAKKSEDCYALKSSFGFDDYSGTEFRVSKCISAIAKKIEDCATPSSFIADECFMRFVKSRKDCLFMSKLGMEYFTCLKRFPSEDDED